MDLIFSFFLSKRVPLKLIWGTYPCQGHASNLPGWCWAEIQQLALVGSSSSLHSEACNALGASDGVIHSSISLEVISLRAMTNRMHISKLFGNNIFKIYVLGLWQIFSVAKFTGDVVSYCNFRKKENTRHQFTQMQHLRDPLHTIPSRPFGYDQV